MIDARTYNDEPVDGKATARRGMFELATKVGVFIEPLNETQRLLGIIAWKLWELEELPQDGSNLDLRVLNEVEDATQRAIAEHPDPQAAAEIGHNVMMASLYLHTKYRQAAGDDHAAEAARAVESREK